MEPSEVDVDVAPEADAASPEAGRRAAVRLNCGIAGVLSLVSLGCVLAEVVLIGLPRGRWLTFLLVLAGFGVVEAVAVGVAMTRQESRLAVVLSAAAAWGGMMAAGPLGFGVAVFFFAVVFAI